MKFVILCIFLSSCATTVAEPTFDFGVDSGVLKCPDVQTSNCPTCEVCDEESWPGYSRFFLVRKLDDLASERCRILHLMVEESNGYWNQIDLLAEGDNRPFPQSDETFVKFEEIWLNSTSVIRTAECYDDPHYGGFQSEWEILQIDLPSY